MNESEDVKPRTRWFQFDLRLLFVLIAAIAVILALGLPRGFRSARGNARKFADLVRVGERVEITVADDTRQLIVRVDEGNRRSFSRVVTEVGDDFIGTKEANGEQRFYPLHAVLRIVRLPSAGPVPATWTKAAATRGGGSSLLGGFPGAGGGIVPGAAGGMGPAGGGFPGATPGVGLPGGAVPGALPSGTGGAAQPSRSR